MNQGDAVAAGRPEPEMRIGTAERESAAKALDEHLNAGRLGVQEYADRSARAANAGVAHEVTELFTDLPAPHPVLPGAAPLPVAGATAEVDGPRPSALDTWGPRIVAASPIIALVLFLVFGQWWYFLLVPLSGALFYGGHGHRRRDDRHDERDRRRATRDEQRIRRDET
ncbi:MAG: DUF1707 domain-containing protein [Pseudonocardia sp.]|nr:DUF1707 domain-containing protein [Pseudonocardia sp.]